MKEKYTIDDFTEGDKIEFTHYSNMDPYPRCVGVIEHIYGASLIQSLYQMFTMDVKIVDVLNNHWGKKELVGRTVRVRNDSDIKKLS